MRYLLFLLFPSLLFADSLRVECSADGFIANVTAARTTGSFTITSANASDIAVAGIEDANQWNNYGSATTTRIGKNLGTNWRWLLRFETLDDSMRTYASGKIIQWDSARVTLTSNAALTSGDSLTIAMYELKSTRRFGEGSSNAAVGLGADWVNYDSTAGVAANAWTTPGAGSTTSDVDATPIDTSVTLINSTTGAGATVSFKLPGTSVSDTINNAGLMFRDYRYGNDDGTTSTVTFRTDDNATAGSRPIITVYYSEMDYVNFGGSDSLIAKAAASAITHLPMFTFDISSLSATADLDSCRWWSYVLNNYSSNGEGSVFSRILYATKPTNIGDNNGTVADNGEMDWVAWDERGSGNDSNWTVAGAGDEGSTCNRSDGSGDDLYIGQNFDVNWASTGWKTIKFDTLYVRKYLNGGCNNFGLALAMTASAGDVAFYKIEADEKSGSANKTWITIYYTPSATTVTRGTGRLGRDNTGVYRNDR